jgi:hypothetical protein
METYVSIRHPAGDDVSPFTANQPTRSSLNDPVYTLAARGPVKEPPE